jgi:hypothetical protein
MSSIYQVGQAAVSGVGNLVVNTQGWVMRNFSPLGARVVQVLNASLSKVGVRSLSLPFGSNTLLQQGSIGLLATCATVYLVRQLWKTRQQSYHTAMRAFNSDKPQDSYRHFAKSIGSSLAAAALVVATVYGIVTPR